MKVTLENSCPRLREELVAFQGAHTQWGERTKEEPLLPGTGLLVSELLGLTTPHCQAETESGSVGGERLPARSLGLAPFFRERDQDLLKVCSTPNYPAHRGERENAPSIPVA